MNEQHDLINISATTPAETNRELLFQAVANSEINDKVTPAFFIANYMKFVSMVIADGNPAKDTFDTYKKHINSFLDWCLIKAKISPFKLTEVHLELYRKELYNTKTVNGTDYNKNSIHNRLMAIKAFYHAAVKQHIMNVNPCADIKAPTININDVPFAYFKMDEIKQLVEYVKQNCYEFEAYRNLVCIYLMAIAGLRCVEVHRANQEDINWNNFTMVVHGKGHDGLIYLDKSTANIIQDYLACLNRQTFKITKEGKNTPLIVSNGPNTCGSRLARNSIRWNINKMLSGAGLKQKGQACHIFRHSCATALYDSTHDLRVVQDTLRHRDPSMTARYAHVVDQLKKRPTSILGKMLD